MTVWYAVGHELDELMDQGIRESAELIHNVLSVLPREVRAAEALPHTDYEQHLVWQVIDPDGPQVLVRSHKAPVVALTARAVAAASDTQDGQWRVVTIPFVNPPGRFLVVAQSQVERSEARAEATQYTVGISLLVGLLTTLLLSWRLRHELKPFWEYSRALGRYDPLDPATQPASGARQELEPIEAAVLDLGRRLAQRVASEQAFTAHAAHALRTPLAGMEVQLSVALRDAPPELQGRLRKIHQSAMRLRTVMQALLAMFRSGREPDRRRVDLADLLAPLSFAPLAVEVAPGAALSVDPDLLSAALLNLLDNSRRYGASRATVGLIQRDGWAEVEITDDGPGCDETTRSRLNAALRHHDYTTEAGLHGLGLMLADLVVRAHDGEMEIRPSSAGFVVRLRFPALV